MTNHDSKTGRPKAITLCLPTNITMQPTSLEDDFYSLYHLCLDEPTYREAKMEGSYVFGPNHPDGILRLVEVSPPHASIFQEHLSRVDDDALGWCDRNCYAGKNWLYIQFLLWSQNTRYFLFTCDGEVVGFALITGIDEFGNCRLDDFVPPEMPQGMLVDLYCNMQGVPDLVDGAIEINKIGMFPEYRGRGSGNYFLSMLLDTLFERHDLVYLNTRSTNDVGALQQFYTSAQFKVFAAERLPNDLQSYTDKKEVLEGLGNYFAEEARKQEDN